ARASPFKRDHPHANLRRRRVYVQCEVVVKHRQGQARKSGARLSKEIEGQSIASAMKAIIAFPCPTVGACGERMARPKRLLRLSPYTDERRRRRCPRCERPTCGAPEQHDDVAPFHSITSSASASSLSGTLRPSALAVLRLITSSYLVGSSTGRSAGFAPSRIRPT